MIMGKTKNKNFIKLLEIQSIENIMQEWQLGLGICK